MSGTHVLLLEERREDLRRIIVGGLSFQNSTRRF
jgi:hypothetical protein